MDDIDKKLLKVRYRNDGEEFHILWAARRVLRLIDLQNDLVAISIEGVSEKEKTGTKAGLLVVDMTEYFHSEDFKKATQIAYCQLKHSTTNQAKNWSAGELREVIEKFAERFKDLVAKHGLSLVKKKVRFQFITNRPISSNVLVAVKKGIDEKSNQLKGHQAKAFKAFQGGYGGGDDNFSDFLSLLVFAGSQKNRQGQDADLALDAQRIMPGVITESCV